MADEKDFNEEGQDEKQKSGGFKLDLKIAVPVLIVQIVLSYFLASMIIVPAFFAPAQAGEVADVAAAPEDDGEFGLIYQVEDVIVNPAESGGANYVVMNIAFEVKESDDAAELEKKDAKVRDALIRTVGSKTVDQLDGADDKEVLRLEIQEKVGKLLSKNHLKNVYFVSYIIQ